MLGNLRGSIIHRQVQQYWELDEAAFKKLNHDAGPHPWTERVLSALLKRQMIPLASELAVHDSHMNVAYRVDGVTVNQETGRISFVELKSAASRELFRYADAGPGGAPMERVLQGKLENSAYTRAMIQSCVGAYMASRALGIKEFDVWVVLVTETAVDFYQAPEAFLLGTTVNVYADMLLAAEERRLASKSGQKAKAVKEADAVKEVAEEEDDDF